MAKILIHIDCGINTCSDKDGDRCEFISASGHWCQIFGMNISDGSGGYNRCQECHNAEYNYESLL